MGNKKNQVNIGQHKIVYVRYQDHHWIEDGSTLDEILEQDDWGANTIVLEEVGFCLVNHKDYIILSGFKTIDSSKPEAEISYEKTIRILKRDILQTKFFDVPSRK